MTNNGTIQAQGGLLTFAPSILTNNGQLVALANSELRLSSASITNAGTITANGTGALVSIYDQSNIRGGTLQAVNGGSIYIQSDNAVLDGETNGKLSLNGSIQVAGNYWPYIRGTIDNSGQISLGSSSIVRVAAGQAATLESNSSTGKLLLNGSYISGFGTTSQFTNGVGHTILGSGQIGNGTLELTNKGTILAQAGNTLNVSPASTFVNSGATALVNANGGVINFNSGSVTNQTGGTFQALGGGSINIQGSAVLTNYSSGTLTGGTYIVDGASQLNLGTGNITTLDQANVRLSGAASTFNGIQTIAATRGGTFEVTNGRSFTTVGDYTNQQSGRTIVGNGSSLVISGALSNTATMEVQAGGSLVANTGNIAQYNGATNSLDGGIWRVGGTMQLNTGSINKLNGAELYLTNISAQVLQSNSSDALASLNQIESGSVLGLGSGVAFSTLSNLTNNGNVLVGDGGALATMNVGGAYNQLAGVTNLDQGKIVASSVAINGGSLTGSGTFDVGSSGTASIDTLIQLKTSAANSSGTLQVNGNLNVTSNAVYRWSLGAYADNSNGNAWDKIFVSGNALIDNATLQLNDWYIDGPNTNNSFWQTNHSWDILLASTISNGFQLAPVNSGNGTFSLNVIDNGGSQALRLSYDITAVPEPTSLALVGLVAACGLLRRSRTETV